MLVVLWYATGFFGFAIALARQKYHQFIFGFAHHMHEMNRSAGGVRMMDKMSLYMKDQQRRIDIASGNEQPREHYEKPYDMGEYEKLR